MEIIEASGNVGNDDAATLLFGTVSGGLSAELTGGNFWQGAATGLVVSGLNHVAHKIQERSYIKSMRQSISDGGYDPDAEVVNNGYDDISNFINAVDELLQFTDGPYSLNIAFADPMEKGDFSGCRASPGQCANVRISKMGKDLKPEYMPKSIKHGVHYTKRNISLYNSAFTSYLNLGLGLGYAFSYSYYTYWMPWQNTLDGKKTDFIDLKYDAQKYAQSWYDLRK